MIKVKVNWDTDGEDIDNLPYIVEVPDCYNIDEVSDWLSDEYGWCVNSLTII